MGKGEQVRALAGLGITAQMVAACRALACAEAPEEALVDAGVDILGRPQRMTAETLRAWQAMRAAAEADGVRLLLVSAYRSFAYQCGLIRRKLDRGAKIEEVLRVNAIPGYSEHHTGQALDLHDGIGQPLTEAFETREAFAWLAQHGAAHGFALSYPRGNNLGIIYEPWHWRFQEA